MNLKELGLIGLILTVFLGCEYDYDKLKEKYLSSGNDKKISKYGSVNGISITDEDMLLAKDILNIKDEIKDINKTLREEIINLIVEKRLLAQNSIFFLEKDLLFKKKLQQVKEELALNMWIERETKKIIEKIKESDLETFYNQNKNLFFQEKQFKLRHIVVKKEDDALLIVEELKKVKNKDKKMEFIKLAKSKSIDSTSEIGGDLGWLNLEGLLPEVETLIQKMSKNEVLNLKTKTALGFHIFYLEGIEEAKYLKFEIVEDDIKEILLKEKIDEHMKKTLEQVKASATIIINN